MHSIGEFNRALVGHGSGDGLLGSGEVDVLNEFKVERKVIVERDAREVGNEYAVG